MLLLRRRRARHHGGDPRPAAPGRAHRDGQDPRRESRRAQGQRVLRKLPALARRLQRAAAPAAHAARHHPPVRRGARRGRVDRRTQGQPRAGRGRHQAHRLPTRDVRGRAQRAAVRQRGGVPRRGAARQGAEGRGGVHPLRGAQGVRHARDVLHVGGHQLRPRAGAQHRAHHRRAVLGRVDRAGDRALQPRGGVGRADCAGRRG